MSVMVLQTSELEAENLRCEQEQETLRGAVMGKSSSAKDSITSSKAGGNLIIAALH